MTGPYTLSYRDTRDNIEFHKAFFDLKSYPTFAEAHHAAQSHPYYRNPAIFLYIHISEESAGYQNILWSYNIRSGVIDHRFNTFADRLRDLVLHYAPSISAEDLAEKTSAITIEDL